MGGAVGHFLDRRAKCYPFPNVGQVVGVALLVVRRVVIDPGSVADTTGNLIHAVRLAPALLSFFFLISLSLSLSLGWVFPRDN